MSEFFSEIRQSDINDLSERAAKHKFGKYLSKVTLKKLRGFRDQTVSFEYPVTALIGTNGEVRQRS